MIHQTNPIAQISDNDQVSVVVNKPIYSPNPGVQATIEKLLALGLPPIPVAPKQDARQSDCHVIGSRKVDSIEVKYCPLIEVNGRLEPKPRFTGKNPSFLTKHGKALICKHGVFQDRLPTEAELKFYFANPETGVGTLCGALSGIDFDRKNFDSQEDCDRAAQTVIALAGAENGWIERSGGDGWRVFVVPEQTPGFTNFAVSLGGKHVGEALGAGRFTVLAPSIHPSGKYYQRVSDGLPTAVVSLEACGIFPSSDEVDNSERAIGRELKRQSDPKYGQPSNPQENPWDIRNFAHYFVGYEERQDGWAYAQCPHHSPATSTTSFRLNLSTGAFKAWCGCSTGDVYRSGLALAVSSGWEKPKDAPAAGTGFKNWDELTKVEQRDVQIKLRTKNFKQRHWEALKRDFQLSPVVPGAIEIEYAGRCENIDLSLAATIGVQGWLGAGKSTAMRSAIAPRAQDEPIAVSTPLNGLGREFGAKAEELGIWASQFQDDVMLNRQMLRTAGQPGLFIMCPESFSDYHFEGIDWSNITLVIDEFAQIRKSARLDKSTWAEFQRAIAECKQLIIADAFLSDACLAVVRKLRPGAIALYRQKHVKSKVSIKWLETRTKEGATSFKHEGIWLLQIEKAISEGARKIAIAVDSKNAAKVFQKHLEALKLGLNVHLVCSETVEQNAVVLQNANVFIKSNNIDIIIYTPTAKSGLDIQIPFDCGFLICFGVLYPTEMLQMLGRCRQCPEWFVSAPRFSVGDFAQSELELDKEALRKRAGRSLAGFAELGLEGFEDLAVWQQWETATRAIANQFNSEYIYALLEEYFEDVQKIYVENCDASNWTALLQQVKTEWAIKVLNANLQHGLELVKNKKQPSKDAEVFDRILAELHQKTPSIIEVMIEAERTWSEADKHLSLYPAFLELVKNRSYKQQERYALLMSDNPQDDIDLAELLKTRKHTEESESFRLAKYIQLHRSLGLDELAKLHGKEKRFEGDFQGNETGFWSDSPVIVELFKLFQVDSSLRHWFPNVETREEFFNELKRCLTFFGFQSVGKTARVTGIPGKLYKEGDKMTEKPSKYCVGWIIYHLGLPKFFKGNQEVFWRAIDTRLEARREKAAKKRETAELIEHVRQEMAKYSTVPIDF